MIDILFLWHMHQPPYAHPATGRLVVPWTRLHACSGYLDMAHALDRHPEVRATVNFVPSLVDQIEGLVAGERDDLERLAERPVDSLDAGERRRVVDRSFSVALRARKARPRYEELWAARRRLAGRATDEELRDLECLFLLAWIGFAARERDPSIDELDAKGKGYTEGDKASLLGAVRTAAAAVLPAWRRLAERGQVELSASPYYHPIVPLLVDSDVARCARPDDPLPPRFAHARDAREQIVRALARHEATFGSRPRGMWPPEGSLSSDAVGLYGECGVGWLAGDEETLARSLPAPSVGDRPPHAKIWRHRGVDLLFRDRDLSDRIGFRYASMVPEDAAADFVARAVAVAGDDGVVGVFLDGENPWENFARRGADFLEALYGRLEKEARDKKLGTNTISRTIEARGGGAELPELHAGSWIDAAFRIWIGDPVKNAAWKELGLVRTRLAEVERALGEGHERVRAARQGLLVAEASDWFWWFGTPNSSAEDPVYDELFRAHLAAAWRALGDEPPAALGRPIAGASAEGAPPVS